MRCTNERVPGDAQVPVTLIVGHDEDDVGRIGRRPGCLSTPRQQDDSCGQQDTGKALHVAIQVKYTQEAYHG